MAKKQHLRIMKILHSKYSNRNPSESFLKIEFIDSYDVSIPLITMERVGKAQQLPFLLLISKKSDYWARTTAWYMQPSLSDWNDAIYLAHSHQTLVRSSSRMIHLARMQFILHPIKMNRSIQRNLDLSIKTYPFNGFNGRDFGSLSHYPS